jgi:5-formyltetrahydrofolate cyclo-ligase
MVDKQTLRSVYLTKRKLLPKTEAKQRASLILDNFKLWSKAQDFSFIHVFLPIERQVEVNVWPIIHWLWKKGINTATSITQPTGNDLMHFSINENTKLITNKWGIPEPVNANPIVNLNELDIILVPLVVFDLEGNRIGYGKGYYDKFLSQCPAKTIKLGIAQTPPLDFISQTNESDVALDSCITHLGLYEFTHGKI